MGGLTVKGQAKGQVRIVGSASTARPVKAGSRAKAKRAFSPAPEFSSLLPMLLDVRKSAPADQAAYLIECKYDGYRCLAEFGEGKARLRSKNGADCSNWFAPVTAALSGFLGPRVICDGEMCILDEYGRTDFDALHARARRRRSQPDDPPFTYVIFDLLAHDGESLMHLPLIERKARLATLMEVGIPNTLYARHITEDDTPSPVSWFYEQAMKLELEGIVGKLKDSVYTPGARTRDWFKWKRPGATPAGRFRRGSG